MVEQKTGWWELTTTIEPNETDLEHIADQIEKGVTEGQLVQEEEEESN